MNCKTSTPPIPPRELFLAHLAGELDAAGVAQLSALIESDPVFRREAAVILRQELQLVELGQRYELAESEPADVEDPSDYRESPDVLTRALAWLDRRRAALRSQAGTRWGGAFAGMAACVVLSLWTYTRYFPPLRCVRVTGRAVIEGHGRSQIAAPRASLRPGDTLRLDTNASVEIAYRRELTSLRFWAGAHVSIGPETAGKTFTLNHGQMNATVASQAASTPLSVLTPQGAATVLGTDFNVNVSTQSTRLEVYEGKVRLADQVTHSSLEVAKGEFGFINNLEAPRGGSIRQGVLRECWSGEAAGDRPLAELRCFTRQPDRVEVLADFAAPPDSSDLFVARLSAWIRPNTTGFYEFWIAGDDRAELWLSPDDQRGSSDRICWTSQWTGPEEWDKSPSQKSALIHLEAGRKYYIQALHSDRMGGDFVAVAWRSPGARREPLGNRVLTPFVPEGADPAAARH
jgi:ferric-dicitrate binding protein FerR (iron transport regulator)